MSISADTGTVLLCNHNPRSKGPGFFIEYMVHI